MIRVVPHADDSSVPQRKQLSSPNAGAAWLVPGEGNSDALIGAVDLLEVPLRGDLRPVTLDP